MKKTWTNYYCDCCKKEIKPEHMVKIYKNGKSYDIGFCCYNKFHKLK